MKGLIKGVNESAPIKLIAFLMLVAAPVVYLIIALAMGARQMGDRGSSEMLFYILLLLAVFSPMVFPVIERIQINAYRKKRDPRMSPDGLFKSLAVIGMAYAGSIFIYGFIAYVVTGDFTRMLYFYAVGAIWSAVYWPRESRKQAFLEKVNAP